MAGTKQIKTALISVFHTKTQEYLTGTTASRKNRRPCSTN